MSPTVVTAYGSPADSQIERELLQAVDAELVHVGSLDSAEAREQLRTADAIMVQTHPVSAELIGSMERCRIISRSGTGLDAIDIPAATARGIWVAYVPDYSIDEVSSHAVGLLLAHARNIPWQVEAVRNGKWVHPYETGGKRRRLRGQKLGVVGFGRIGQAMAAKSRALGLEIIAHDPFLSGGSVAGTPLVDLETLLRESDYISLHVPLTDANRRFLDSQAFALMKPTAIVINTARGGLIDEEALLNAVQSGQIGGAAIDVLTVEPPPADHPLLHEPRILVTPHSGWYSEDAAVDVRVRAAEEVVRVLKGETPRCPVNKVEA